MNRRRLLALIPAIAGAGVATAATPELVKPRRVVIAGRFEFEGKRYGLGVPIFEPGTDVDRARGIRTVEFGDDIVELGHEELRLTVEMLKGLLSSWDATLKQLIEGKGVDEWHRVNPDPPAIA